MPTRVRVNLANAQELLELPGLSPDEVEIIVRLRGEHGPIGNADQLARILNGHPYVRHAQGARRFLPVRQHCPRGSGCLAARESMCAVTS
jgi:Helix-hairpin-helix motif